MTIMTKNKYSQFFNDDPWDYLNDLCYPEGRRLYLNDERFWVSIDNAGRIMFFVHEVGKVNLKALTNLASLDIKIDDDFLGATRLCCILIDSDDDLKNKFSIVAKDIAHNCSKFSGYELLNKVQLRIKSWANFLKASRTGLSNSEYVGFWGELYFVSQILMKIQSPSDAVRFWIGPEGKKQDITLNSIAIEIKTSSSGDARTIKISSIDQLEKITESLFLMHIITSPSNNDKGASLKELYENCLQLIDHDLNAETLFLLKISDLYGKANEEQLNDKLSTLAESMYEVRDDFPCLTRNVVLPSIASIQYEIFISSLKNFEITNTIQEVIKNG
jgi:hypothetical protein